ncbi:MAG: GNAT family N-acetyltransferase [Clostridiales bacterium]|jgi:predicted N-acetyltransferase YhbS|nr:GNAT family N-acetyltransferase [Clostridiales bacterium]
MLTTGEEKDYKRIIRMINKAFRSCFPLLLPKVYRNRPEYAVCHRYAQDDKGRMIAATAVIPMTLHVGDRALKCAGVGSVATLKKARGKGLMNEMLLDAVKIGTDSGVQLMMLGGKRLRYERYGFVPSGFHTEFKVTDHAATRRKTDGYSFLKLKKNGGYLENIIRSHDTLEMRAEREKDNFSDILSSYFNTAYVVLKDGEYCGYLVKNIFGKTIEEIVLDGAEITDVVSAFVKFKRLKNVNVVVSPCREKDTREMYAFADAFKQQESISFNVLDYPAVIETMLVYKAKSVPLTDGEFNLGVDENTYKISVKSNTVAVTPSKDLPDAVFTKSQATILMFFPNNIYAEQYPLLKAWFPLPLYISAVDKV